MGASGDGNVGIAKHRKAFRRGLRRKSSRQKFLECQEWNAVTETKPKPKGEMVESVGELFKRR
jgi:hypothetical protein